MTNEVSANPVAANADESETDTRAEMPAIRILIYTDDPSQVTESEDPQASRFGVGLLKKHIEAHKPRFAKTSICLRSRNPDANTHATEKLDSLLNEPFEQLWVFGLHQVNIDQKFSLDDPAGGPHSELDANEVERLKEWMKKGGVLMTGDHSNPDPHDPPGDSNECPTGADHETFLCRGRALGYRVPRAGLLRRWEGPPTSCPGDNFNTQMAPDKTFDDPKWQSDEIPQELTLKTFSAWGAAGENPPPHPLFIGREGREINVFPDHMHEGRIIIPREFSDTTVWPEVGGFQPRPQALAYGRDKRNDNIRALVGAYDGDCVGAGRIVTDTTWHHYFNINLAGFTVDTSSATPGGLIGQYYGNLVTWLAPLETRREMACAMFYWLARHPLILKEAGSGVPNIGKIASDTLSQTASPCEIHELLQAWLPCALRARCRPLYFPKSPAPTSPIPPQEIMLGSVVDRYQQEMAGTSSQGLFRLEQTETAGRLIEDGLARAFNLQHGVLHGTESVAPDLLTFFGAAGGGG